MKNSSFRNLWSSLTKTLSRGNARWHSAHSKSGRVTTPQHTKAQQTPGPTKRESNLNNNAISDSTSDPREEDWPTDDSFIIEPDFSVPMLDNVSEEYQSKAITRATEDIGGSADETGSQAHTSRWLQDLPSKTTPFEVDDTRGWPNSNETREKEEAIISCLNATGQFKAPSTASESTTPHTAEVLQEMSYIGGMNYARARLQEATASGPSGKEKQIRPSPLLAQTSVTGPHGDSCSSSPSSKAASARSSAYKVVHEAAKARKALIDAQIGVKHAASQQSERKARCDREHQAKVEEIEAVQSELRSSIKRQEQGQEVQTARMDAMGYRMAEMKNLMAQREVHMEAQTQEVCTQIQAMGSLLKNIQPQPTGSTIKNLLQDTVMSLPKPTKNVTLKSTEDVASVAKPFGAKYRPMKNPPQDQHNLVSIEPASTKRHVLPRAVPSKGNLSAK